VAVRIRREEFERLVGRALDSLPKEFGELLENVFVVVEDEPAIEDLEAMGLGPEDDDLFGLYQGVPQPDRDVYYSALPDRVVIYRGPICRYCRSREEAVQEIRDTVVHELGHHFGMEEEDLPY
jgi:predicted Zn-dependent protease with MMP-like domain